MIRTINTSLVILALGVGFAYPSVIQGRKNFRIMSRNFWPGHLSQTTKIANGSLRLLSFLVYELNEFFAEALVSTRNLEDLGIAFLGQSLFRKCPLHL